MNEKWFSLDISSVEKKLKTNAASGLSPRAARSRYKKGGEPLYIAKKKSVGKMLGEIVADFSLILLIIASVLALCFTEYTTGVTLTVIIALNLGAALFLSYRSCKLFDGISSAFRPSVIVVRGGKAFSVDIERVVVGDVVLLSEGDVIGFDARLVTSDKLKVKIKVDRKTEAVADKFAEGRVRDNENDVRAMVNMVHAGSTVISGGARAVVTATGLNTYLGALTGGIRLPDNKRVPQGLTLLKKYCSDFGFAVMIALLPFCILSLFFSKGNVTLMTSFSAALAIAASSMSQLACTACRIFFAKHARLAIEAQNPVAIASADVMDELVSVEYLLLLDGSAVSDGILHYYKAICADGELKTFNAISPSMKNFAELVAMYDSAEKRTLTTGIHTPGRFSRALGEFVNKNEVDIEALKIRCNITGYVPGNSVDKTDKLFFMDKGHRRILHVTQDASVISLCRKAYIGGGVSVLSATGSEELASQFAHYSRMGMKVLVFSVTDEEFSNEHIFAGMIILSEAVDNGFDSAIAGMEALGIKTLTFTRSDRANATQIPAPILKRVASREDFIRTGKDVTYKFGEIDTYKDMTATDIDVIIRHIHSMKKKVALLCFSDEYKECREKPDAFITCSSLQHRLLDNAEEQLDTIEIPGGADSTSCRQDIKRDADIIIPRPSKRSGGLLSLKRAFLMSGAAYNNLTGFFRYVLCSQFIRIAMVMIPMLFSETHLDARHALLCGFVMDIMAMLVFVTEKCGVETASGFRSLSREFKSPIRNNAGVIIASVAGGLVAVILPNIINLMGFMGPYFYQTEYLFIAMTLLHIVVMFCIMIDNLRRFGRAEMNRMAIVATTSMLGFVMSCFMIEPLAVLFDTFKITWQYLLLTPVPAGVTAALYFALRDFRLSYEE